MGDQQEQQSSSSLFVPTCGFDDIEKGILKWYCPPPQSTKQNIDKNGWWKVVESSSTDKENNSNNVLLLAPPAKRDFWRKTYYEPLLVKDDGPFVYRTITKDELPIMVQTTFEISNPKSQFDQGGIIVRLDHEHWIKTGIEVVDNIPRLSCVVTNGFSDWSTQTLSGPPSIKIRVHILPQNGGSVVVESAPIGGEEWSFIRIAHLNKDMNHNLLNDTSEVKNAYQGEDAPNDSIMCGLFGACPVDQEGMVVKFYDFSITQGSTFVHDAD
jgi:regulation of enolase protein 1 (concanavalin A-like superfamily)